MAYFNCQLPRIQVFFEDNSSENLAGNKTKHNATNSRFPNNKNKMILNNKK